jgi:DNA ligase (NAD+)
MSNIKIKDKITKEEKTKDKVAKVTQEEVDEDEDVEDKVKIKEDKVKIKEDKEKTKEKTKENKELKINITKELLQLNKDPLKYATNINITTLASLIDTLAFAYYNTNKPLVTDAIYDLLLDTLTERDPDNPQLKKTRSTPDKNKVKLPCFLPSLDKIKPNTPELNKWLTKFKSTSYVLSDKLDGATGLLYKKNNKLFLFSNSDEGYGQNITHLINHIMPNIKVEDIEDEMCIRGELIISKENFEKLNKENSNKYKNGRNTVSGLINSKNYSVTLANATQFITYTIINNKNNDKNKLTQEQQLFVLKELNFDVVEYKISKKLTEDILSSYLLERRKLSKFEVDGIVVSDNNVHDDTQLKTNPEHSFAYKQILEEQIATTQVLKVNWEPSRHGYLKPTIDITPVNLVGVTIKHCTVFHAKYVVDNVIGPGSKIKIIRSGDVIPHILEVLTSSTSKKPQLPEDIDYKWDETKTNIYVDVKATKNIKNSKLNEAITTKIIANFFKKLNVKYISTGLIAKLVANNYNSIFKILEALYNSQEELYDIPGLGQTIITKIKENTEEAISKMQLDVLMTASNTLGIGISLVKTKMILETYPDILIKNYNKEELQNMFLELNGFDIKTANLVSSNFEKFKTFFNEMSKIVDLSNIKKYKIKKIIKNNKLNDKIIVFTGFRDKELEEYIVSNGGKVSTSVSKNSSVVVYSGEDASNSSKYKEAVKLELELLNKEEFIKKYKN